MDPPWRDTGTKTRPKSRSQEEPRPEDVLGQISYGPATQTTVVTTTTTTTTNFPPFVLKAPQHLHDLDPKQYPLAASPTPQSIKKLCFEVEGKPTIFEEADDTLDTIEKLKKQREALSQSHGALQSVTHLDPDTERSMPARPVVTMQGVQTPPQRTGLAPRGGLKRPASPVSISEAARLAGQPGSRKRRAVLDEKKRPDAANAGPSAKRVASSKLQIMQTSTPITPHLGNNDVAQDQQSAGWDSRAMQGRNLGVEMSRSTSSTFDMSEDHEQEAQVLSPKSDVAESARLAEEDAENAENESFTDRETQRAWRDLGIGSALTPRVDGEAGDEVSRFQRPIRQPQRRPSNLNFPAAQDASLPSPSLSPVTAAANLQNRRNYFEQPNADQSSGASSFERSANVLRSISTRDFNRTPEISQQSSSREVGFPETDRQDEQLVTQSMMTIPTMVDCFEAIPEELKSYMMYQFLKRCSKSVLHLVADVVNPALKCDFLKLLPVELCLNVISNLDVTALCSAAQVSKRWRNLINSAEKVWTHRFNADGYTLQEGELPRATREGWGWQFASQLGDAEQDLSLLGIGSSDTEISVTSPSAASRSTRSKRKGKARPKLSGRKQAKRRKTLSTSSVDLDEEALLDMTSANEGPYAAAAAAYAAVPNPRVGLPSLQHLHLFKSIYMRHHIMRKTWMQDEVTPRHIAFRAHQRHVVTCLQFDADKILTGSDDAKINVYDTQTGALRAILEGHEGGVWALQYEGNVLVSGSTDRAVRVWDIERGVCTQTFQGHTSTVRCLQILMPTVVGKTADGRNILMPKQPLIITGSRDTYLRVWRLPKPGEPAFHQAGPAVDDAECPYFVRLLTGHHHSVRAIAAHADTLVSGSYDCSVRVWKISTGETVHRLQGHTQKVYSVVLDHKRNRCISGSMDNVVKVWSLETGTSLFNLEGHSSLVGLLDLQQDRLVSAAADSTLRIWDPENGHCKSTLSAHTGAITCFQHDGQKVISGSDRTLKMWNVSNGEFVKDLLTDLSGVWQVKFNDRRCVAAVQRNNLTYIEVLDFGASRDGVPENKRGKRIVVDADGHEIFDVRDMATEAEIVEDDP